MNLVEFLADKDHDHCKHCPHAVLKAPILSIGAEHFDAINTIIHLATCHPDIVADDILLRIEVMNTYGLEL